MRRSPREAAKRQRQVGIFGVELPHMAEHERERKKKVKPPVGKRGRQLAERKTKESKVTVDQRLREFPNQSFKNSGGKLYCAACKVMLTNIKTSISIKAHISYEKHKTALLKLAARATDDKVLVGELSEFFAANPDRSERLHSPTRGPHVPRSAT